jgi:hypothetical protein
MFLRRLSNTIIKQLSIKNKNNFFWNKKPTTTKKEEPDQDDETNWSNIGNLI